MCILYEFRMWLPPGQTRNAVVVCYIPPNVDVGTKDKITFSSQGMNMASQEAMLTVSSPVSAGTVRKKLKAICIVLLRSRISLHSFLCYRIERRRRYTGIMVAGVMAEPKLADVLAQFGHWKSQPSMWTRAFYVYNRHPKVY